MDELNDLHDWELLHSSDSPHKELESSQLNYESDAGMIKDDYFSLDSSSKYPKRAPSEEGEEDTLYPSDNPSWVDPESFPTNQPREFWSDESNYTEKREIGQLSGERHDSSDLGSETCDSIPENGEKELEKRWDVWWKVPFEMIKLFVLRIRPVWSLSALATILGVVVLGRKLLKSKVQYKSRSLMPLKIVHDEKRATQLKARAGRLNEAFSAVKRVSLIRATFPAGAVTPSPVLGLY
ncbi:transmembrane protein [Rhynchospora pubera]|uniref:Transmembrane protein n=1 Tax=Rhynchospora pubera TaxID=906938 RepID=A0AAV8C0U8_9POAL|nr:transmembrane protein [Rhynchospora pubera]